MKQLISLIFLLVSFSLGAMQEIVVPYTEDINSHDRRIVSLFDAYMNGYMERDGGNKFMFSDYKNPTSLHSCPIEKINELVYGVSKILAQGISDDVQELIIDAAFNTLEVDPFNFTEEQAADVQIIRMGDFLIGQDLPNKLGKNTKAFIRANRAKYQAAWGTQNAENILEAMRTCKLHASEKPYMSLLQQIAVSKTKALEKNK